MSQAFIFKRKKKINYNRANLKKIRKGSCNQLRYKFGIASSFFDEF